MGRLNGAGGVGMRCLDSSATRVGGRTEPRESLLPDQEGGYLFPREL